MVEWSGCGSAPGSSGHVAGGWNSSPVAERGTAPAGLLRCGCKEARRAVRGERGASEQQRDERC